MAVQPKEFTLPMFVELGAGTWNAGFDKLHQVLQRDLVDRPYVDKPRVLLIKIVETPVPRADDRNVLDHVDVDCEMSFKLPGFCTGTEHMQPRRINRPGRPLQLVFFQETEDKEQEA